MRSILFDKNEQLVRIGEYIFYKVREHSSLDESEYFLTDIPLFISLIICEIHSAEVIYY
jgi:hypothetical protein